jgi:hypothetical protein
MRPHTNAAGRLIIDRPVPGKAQASSKEIAPLEVAHID